MCCNYRNKVASHNVYIHTCIHTIETAVQIRVVPLSDPARDEDGSTCHGDDEPPRKRAKVMLLQIRRKGTCVMTAIGHTSTTLCMDVFVTSVPKCNYNLLVPNLCTSHLGKKIYTKL